MFSGYDEQARTYDKSSWDYELDEQGHARIDDTWQHPRCVINLLRRHVERYTPETVSRICGTPQDKYLEVCALIATTAAPDKALASLFALGWTQHSVGSQNIRTMAMVQLLLGNIGVAGGGMNALRGHSNIQGLTDVGLLSAQIPGYLTLPKDGETSFEEYMQTRQYKPLRPGQTSYWQNYRKFIVSFQKAIYGDAARADNDWAYDWLPKLDNDGYDILRAFEMMLNGEINGYICQGFNPQQAFPDRGKIRRALSKLKFLVMMDPLDTETSRFWQDFGPQNPSDPASDPDRSLPAADDLLRRGERLAGQLLALAAMALEGGRGTGRSALRHLDHVGALPSPARDVPQGRRRLPRSDPEPRLELHGPDRPDPEELAKDMNGRALADLKDESGAVALRAGQLLDGFAQLRDDGTTSSGCWIFSGCYTEKGNQMARRDATDPREQGIAPNWAWAWPANRRILYNRASADPAGNPWNPHQAAHSSGTAAGGSASTSPTMRRPPSRPTGSVRSS